MAYALTYRRVIPVYSGRVFFLTCCLVGLLAALPLRVQAETLTAVTLTPNLPSPQTVDTTIILTAAATGGTNVQYQFWVYDPAAATAWSELQAYSASATCSWTPSAMGSYLLSLTARDGVTGLEVSTMLWYKIGGPPLTAVALATDPASPQPVGTSIALSATASGGTNVLYQFWVYDPNTTPAWSQLQAYSSLAGYSWKPAAPGNYLLSCSAQDGITGAEVSTTHWYTISGPPLTGVFVDTDPDSPQPINTPITLTAAATGGTAVQYQFWVYNSAVSPAWQELQAYSASATCNWQPVVSGDSLLSVSARDGLTGTEVSTLSWYAVTSGPLLTAVSVSLYPAQPQAPNFPITLTAAATGGSKVQYQFWVYRPAATPAWSQLQAYSASATCQWTPSAAGNYFLSVSARDGVTNGEVSTTLWDTIANRTVFPADNPWNEDISKLPVDPNSAALIASIGLTTGLHPDFGTVWDGAPNGIPYIYVSGKQPKVPVSFDYADESDPGPYPIPPNAPIEGGPSSTGDRHVLVIDEDNWILYEMFAAYPQNGGTSWQAGSGAIFNLNSDALRPAGWTSADAAGLPIFAGLVRYDEVMQNGVITHALRFTVQQTRHAYVYPARHYASSLTSPNLPPMGMRVRLKASFDISGYPPCVQVILTALKKYGMFVADNGSNWYISGAPDPRWSDDDLATIHSVTGSNFEVVQMGTIVTQ